jgi:hypothetical protein
MLRICYLVDTTRLPGKTITTQSWRIDCMKKITELILHCLDSKSEIFEKADFYFLSASWGKRDVSNLASQLKGRFALLSQAQCELNRLANTKKKKGYAKAKLNLYIPGHKGTEYNEHRSSTASGSLLVETKGESELGVDEHGNSLRSLI